MGIIEEKNNIYDFGETRGILKEEMETILSDMSTNKVNNNDVNTVCINYNGIMIFKDNMMKMRSDGVIKKNFSFEEQIEILHFLKEDIKNGLVVLAEEQLSIVNELDKKLNSNFEVDKQLTL